MTRTLFITGTDTEVGKTQVAEQLIAAAAGSGLRVAGFKPVASGAERTPTGLINDDARRLASVSRPPLPVEAVNPYVFEPAIAPHIAAAEAGVSVERAVLDAAHRHVAEDRDLVVVEGAGGWRVPLGDGWDFADWVGGHRWPVLLVVGMKLGCINHALLSADALRACGVPVIGWIANHLPPAQPRAAENLAHLKRNMTIPWLGELAAHAPLSPAVWQAVAQSLAASE